MHLLTGKAVDDVLIEWVGPIKGRNYNTAGLASPEPATVEVQVWGTGAVQLQHCETAQFRTPGGSPNLFGVDRVPSTDPTDWADVGSAIDASSGLTSVAITVPSGSASWLRVIVDTAGTGRFAVKSLWW